MSFVCATGLGIALHLGAAPSARADEAVLSTGTYPLSGLRDGYTNNQTFSGSLGYQFTTGNAPLTVTALGWYDGPNSAAANTAGYTADGLNNAHVVGIWNASGGLVTSVTVGTSSTTAVNDYQYESLGAPLMLGAGTTYTVGDAFYTVDANTLFGPGVTAPTGVYTYSGGGNTLAEPTQPSSNGFLGPGFLYSVPVSVNNGTFASPGTGGYTAVNSSNQTWNTAIVNWGSTVTNTANHGSVGVIVDSNPGGSQAAYINANGNDIYQDLGTLSANTLYTVTVYISLRADGGDGAAGNIALLLGDTDAGSVVASTPYATDTGTFVEYSVEYLTGSSVSGDLTLELSDTTGTGDQSVAFGDVSVATLVPEPASTALLAVASLGLLKRRHGA
jgi:hypothetical protein